MLFDLINIVAYACAACHTLCARDGLLTGAWLSQAIFTKVTDETGGHDTSRDLITPPVVNLKRMFTHTQNFSQLFIPTHTQTHTHRHTHTQTHTQALDPSTDVTGCTTYTCSPTQSDPTLPVPVSIRC